MRNLLIAAAVLLAVHVVVLAAPEVMTEQQTSATAITRSPVQEIIVVIKTHFDIGYTHRVGEIVHHFRTGMIDKAISPGQKSFGGATGRVHTAASDWNP